MNLRPLLVIIILTAVSCGPADFEELEATEADLAAGCCLIQTVNGQSRKVEVYDPKVGDWNNSTALKWSLSPPPTTVPGGTYYSGPVAARLRSNTVWGGTVLAVGSTKGFFGIYTYPGKTRLYSWYMASANLHGVELLPNGNVAVAGSTGNVVRLYAASTKSYPSNVSYAEDKTTETTDAHQLLWDPLSKKLWMLSHSYLCSYSDIGTSSTPALRGRECFKTPWGGGHDLQPYFGNTNLLILTTGSFVYTFDKTMKTFAEVTVPGVSRRGVKGIGRNDALSPAQWVETVPDGVSCGNTWSTNTVDFLGYLSNAKRTKTGACFYRATYFTSDYQ